MLTQVQGQRDDWEIGADSPLFDVDLGPYDKQNFTFSYQLSPLQRMGYEVYTAAAYRGFSDAANISWVPIPSLNRTDADVSAILIAPNIVTYAQSVDDPVFQANGSIKNPIRTSELGTEQVMYLSDNTLRIVACADQHEFCDPISGACSGLDGHLSSGIPELLGTVNNKQWATIVRIQHDSLLYTMEGSVRSLGDNGKFSEKKLLLLLIAWFANTESSPALIAKSIMASPMLISPGLDAHALAERSPTVVRDGPRQASN
ncbi:uncharacterized protein J7T54_008180 [Emericellopsis cladophorae]|uniref:Uncharacterized protein n=1 Tax=Emericellopsis cladophorae TaxID=2686198 RepID=A0A9P9Y7W6_9HYPO|nr:uncharacterized protein J7T54_008180 [Emericellopsis cladophorae]KAI6785086.1 hypothetical protein J7T54_008180 [Emericellopsis cladophorae]